MQSKMTSSLHFLLEYKKTTLKLGKFRNSVVSDFWLIYQNIFKTVKDLTINVLFVVVNNIKREPV